MAPWFGSWIPDMEKETGITMGCRAHFLYYYLSWITSPTSANFPMQGSWCVVWPPVVVTSRQGRCPRGSLGIHTGALPSWSWATSWGALWWFREHLSPGTNVCTDHVHHTQEAHMSELLTPHAPGTRSNTHNIPQQAVRETYSHPPHTQCVLCSQLSPSIKQTRRTHARSRDDAGLG